jgi:hypothetical protein
MAKSVSRFGDWRSASAERKASWHSLKVTGHSLKVTGASEVGSRYPSALYALECDCYATVSRDLIVGWTYSTQNELAFLSSCEL